MTEITIKKEMMPSRCDTCHQADCFNPETGYCERCKSSSLQNYAQAIDVTDVASTTDVDSLSLWLKYKPIWGSIVVSLVASSIAILIALFLVGETLKTALSVSAIISIFVVFMGWASYIHQENMRRMKTCPFCAQLILKQAIKCRYCSSFLPQK